MRKRRTFDTIDLENAIGPSSQAGGTLDNRNPTIVPTEPRTGVGRPDERAEAAGAELGGDAGDVNIVHNEAGTSLGGTRGASPEMEAAPYTTRKNAPASRKPGRHAA